MLGNWAELRQNRTKIAATSPSRRSSHPATWIARTGDILRRSEPPPFQVKAQNRPKNHHKHTQPKQTTHKQNCQCRRVQNTACVRITHRRRRRRALQSCTLYQVLLSCQPVIVLVVSPTPHQRPPPLKVGDFSSNSCTQKKRTKKRDKILAADLSCFLRKCKRFRG